MQTTEIKIPAAVVHMWKFVSEDIHRSNLTNLMIEADSTGLGWVAVATDAHRLVKVTWARSSESEKIDGDRLFISRYQLKTLASFSKKKDVQLVCSEGSLTATAMFGVSVPVALADPRDVHFPDYTQIIPTTINQSLDVEPVGVNPAYLIEALDHAKKYVCIAPRGVLIDLPRWTGPEAPMIFIANSKDLSVEATYIVMPMRI